MRLDIKLFIVALLIPVFVFAKTHIVKKGESLSTIAKKYGVSVKDIVKANNLKKPYIIKPGQKLKIPEKKTASKSRKKSNLSECKIVHKVRPGDTLIKIAKKYHVWVKDLRKLNNLRNDNLKVGQVLCVKKGKPKKIRKSTVSSISKKKKRKIVITTTVIHKVKKGESLALIAKKYNTSVKKIIKANKLKKPYIIRPGQKLKIPIKKVKEIVISDEDKIKQVAKSMPFGFIWPVDGEVISSIGETKTGDQLGIEIKSECGEPVKSAESGKVIFSGKINKYYGNMVVIRHRKKFMTIYSHLDKIAVKDQQYVKKGQIIGYTGNIANRDICGIHFQIRKNMVPVNPLALLPDKNKKEVNR